MQMLLEQTVTIKWNARNIAHYKSLGYEFTKCGDEFEVDVVELTVGCRSEVIIKCDKCGQEFVNRYDFYMSNKKNSHSAWDACPKCVPIKRAETNVERYGGVSPSQNADIQRKIADTNLKRYGAINPGQNEDVKRKIKESFIKNWGTTHPMKTAEGKRRVRDTLAKNGTCPTSIPQRQLFEIIRSLYPDAKLNMPFDYYNLDIAVEVNGINMDIEYDGFLWHKGREKHDFLRDKHMKEHGWKVLRIRGVTLLPSIEQVLQTVEMLSRSSLCFLRITMDDWVNHEKYYDSHSV